MVLSEKLFEKNLCLNEVFPTVEFPNKNKLKL